MIILSFGVAVKTVKQYVNYKKINIDKASKNKESCDKCNILCESH